MTLLQQAYERWVDLIPGVGPSQRQIDIWKDQKPKRMKEATKHGEVYTREAQEWFYKSPGIKLTPLTEKKIIADRKKAWHEYVLIRDGIKRPIIIMKVENDDKSRLN